MEKQCHMIQEAREFFRLPSSLLIPSDPATDATLDDFVGTEALYESHAPARPGNASLASMVIRSTAADGLSNAGLTSMYMEGGFAGTLRVASYGFAKNLAPLLGDNGGTEEVVVVEIAKHT